MESATAVKCSNQKATCHSIERSRSKTINTSRIKVGKLIEESMQEAFQTPHGIFFFFFQEMLWVQVYNTPVLYTYLSFSICSVYFLKGPVKRLVP